MYMYSFYKHSLKTLSMKPSFFRHSKIHLMTLSKNPLMPFAIGTTCKVKIKLNDKMHHEFDSFGKMSQLIRKV